jgi:hypothetical protein
VSYLILDEVRDFIEKRISTLGEAATGFEELGYKESVDRMKAVIRELELLLRYINGDKNAYLPKDISISKLESLPQNQKD